MEELDIDNIDIPLKEVKNTQNKKDKSKVNENINVKEKVNIFKNQ